MTKSRPAETASDLLALDEALTSLAEPTRRQAELVKLRFFAGLTIAEAAAGLGISPATADRSGPSPAWLLPRARADDPSQRAIFSEKSPRSAIRVALSHVRGDAAPAWRDATMASLDATTNAIFCRPLEIEPPPRRRRYLDEACGGDAALRQRVEALLHAHDKPAASWSNPPAADQRRRTHRLGEPVTRNGAGTVIGPYKLLEQIGEGGMGIVYMAEQTEPVQRTVALKIIKPGMDTRR